MKTSQSLLVLLAVTCLILSVRQITAVKPDCSSPVDEGELCPGDTDGKGKVTRVYFDPATKRCVNFVYKGCGGNKNNFDSFSCFLSCTVLGL